jgi:crotonobetainyl-CoA:carnitine CoA-transferase CaiB-like acyl-CoA transferase
MTDDERGAPLSGIRVLDFSNAAAGPIASLYLADVGADVVKVERPESGDISRRLGVPMFGPLDTDYVVSANRSKRSIVIDLATPRGRELARELAAQSDVVIQNFRPGVAAKLGVDFEAVRELRPGLVYCSISGFGEGGPLGGRPANDVIMQAASGLMSVTGERDGRPVKMGSPIADFSTGLFALIGILIALQCRDEHPEGQHVTVSMLESSLAMMAGYVPRVVTLGKQIPRLGSAHPQIVPYQAFDCADGNLLMVGAFTDGFWRSLCKVVGHPEWITDERFATNPDRMQNRDELIGLLDAIFATEPREHWQTQLDSVGVPNSALLGLDEVLASEQVRHLGSVLHLKSELGEVDVIDFPAKSTAWSRPEPTWPPSLGQHSADVLRDVLELDPNQIDELLAERVVQ